MPPSTVDDYILTLESDQQSEFKRIQSLVMQVAPSVEQGTSYGLPTYTVVRVNISHLRISNRFEKLNVINAFFSRELRKSFTFKNAHPNYC